MIDNFFLRATAEAFGIQIDNEVTHPYGWFRTMQLVTEQEREEEDSCNRLVTE